MNLFESVLEARGYPLSRARRHLAEIQSLSPAEFVAWQDEERWRIVEHHLRENPFYRAFYRANVGSKKTGWSELPILSKADLQRPIEQLLSDSFDRRSVHLDNTSGSSGHPFWYAKDRFCHALSWALIRHRYGTHGLTTRSRQARFYGIPRDRVGFLREKTKDRIMNRRRFPVFDLSAETLDDFVRLFRRDPFEYLYGYTQSLVLFARRLVERSVSLANECPSLRLCMVTSEVCTAEDRALLERAFGVPVVNEYGASEASIIAFEFPGGDWLLSEETLYVETSEAGELLITSLFNRAYPLIRYRIGDLGRIGEERIAGRYRRLLALEGRTNDVVELPSGKRAAGLTFYYVCRGILERSDAVREFIVRQTALDTFVLDVVSSRELEAPEIQMVHDEATRYLEPGLHIEVRRVEAIERPESGKIRQFYSELSISP